jgi:hypothetical protein
VELITTTDVPVTKRYYFEGRHRTDYFGPDQPWGKVKKPKVQVKLEFLNNKDNRMGMPLPKGKVRVYKADEDKSLQFIGEDEIDHTPKDEKVRLHIGNAFDIVGEWRQTNLKKIAPRVWEETIEVKLRNHKDADIEVIVQERAFADWEIIQESQEHKKQDAFSFEYLVPVKSNGESTVTYTIRFTW